ncbi:hypothetical protein I4F81_000260 [Pyropia yezoensis]|uniref:Uncharacterized protein n=1 Tax=Pyropia yezoensis TaxID=2788 RepID=A0ACC3BIB4_PYRYE|nr:hypothetical protein I4F81_000260 [Neopyropia yezoensis]
MPWPPARRPPPATAGRPPDGGGAGTTRSIDPLTHYFEALLGWYDALPPGGERAAVAAEATRASTFIVNQTVVGEAGDAAASAYVAYNYDTDWTPTAGAYSRGTQWTTAATATPPHGMELAFLLSRAEQRGLAPPGGGRWVATAYRLIRYAEKYAFDARGWLRYEVTTYGGAPLAGNPDNDVRGRESRTSIEKARIY